MRTVRMIKLLCYPPLELKEPSGNFFDKLQISERMKK